MDNRTEDKEAAAYDESLKGTFVSVFFIGAAILLSWLIIFYLYTDKV